MIFTFEEADITGLSDEEFNSFEDKLIFQTKEWITFLARTQNATPVVLKIYADGYHIGFFSGLIFRKFGIRIMGSPFRGWTTLYMGFNLKKEISISNRAQLIKPLWEYVAKEYKCVYFEIIDRFITEEDAKKSNLRYDLQGTLKLDLSGTEEDVQLRFTKACRKHVRKFDKTGARCSIVEPSDAFAEEFYGQLCQVFAYQKLVPSYDLERIRELLKALAPSGRVLCLRVEDPEGKCRGMSISLGFNGRAYAWASTSLREGVDYCQSEGLRWHAIQYWRNQECWDYDMAGIREYKYRFNPEEIQVPRIILTRYPILIKGRDLAQKMYWKLNALKGSMKG